MATMFEVRMMRIPGVKKAFGNKTKTHRWTVAGPFETMREANMASMAYRRENAFWFARRTHHYEPTFKIYIEKVEA